MNVCRLMLLMLYSQTSLDRVSITLGMNHCCNLATLNLVEVQKLLVMVDDMILEEELVLAIRLMAT